jgi:DNA-binding ferritin-like protein
MKSFIDFRRGLNEQEDMEDNPSEIDTSNELEVEPVEPISKEGTIGILDMNALFRSLLEFHSQLRAFHWQTKSFPQHTSAGLTYDSVDDILDKLVEAYQGYMGDERIRFGGQLNLLDYEEVNAEKWLSNIESIIKQLRESTERVFKGSSDLLNIMDELLGAVSKFKYLLTLK